MKQAKQSNARREEKTTVSSLRFFGLPERVVCFVFCVCMFFFWGGDDVDFVDPQWGEMFEVVPRVMQLDLLWKSRLEATKRRYCKRLQICQKKDSILMSFTTFIPVHTSNMRLLETWQPRPNPNATNE